MDYSKKLITYFKQHKWVQFFNLIDTFTNKILQGKHIFYPFRDDIIQEMRYYAVTLTRKFLSGATNINKYKEYLSIAMKHEIFDMIRRNKYHYFIPKRGSKYYKNQSYEELLEFIYCTAESNSDFYESPENDHCHLMDFINRLKSPENDVLKLYYGINESKNYTLEEIADILDMSHKATVYNILKRALKKLREILIENEYEE